MIINKKITNMYIVLGVCFGKKNLLENWFCFFIYVFLYILGIFIKMLMK